MPTATWNEVRSAFDEVVAQARNLIEAHEARNPEYEPLTHHEMQELAMLYIRLDDLRETRDRSA